MKKIILSLVTLIVIFSSFIIDTPVLAESSEYSSALGMCVIDSGTHRVLYSKNMDARLPMASTTKIITALTVIENVDDLDQKIVVDHRAVGVEGSSIYLRKNEELSVRDLLYGLMLRSGNDSAEALAYFVSGSIEKFADKMNELVSGLGLNNTHLCNPHGLDNPEHYTSAYDLAVITSYALSNPIFKEIVSTKLHTVKSTNVSETRYMSNKNKLLSTLEGCIGVKTGYTTRAGRCLVSACERNDERIVCVVLGCGPMFEESKRLIESSYADYNYEKILDSKKTISHDYTIDDQSGRLYLYSNEDVYMPIKPSERDKLTFEYNISSLNAESGSEVGEIKIFFDKHLIKSVKLITMNKIDNLGEDNLLKFEKKLWED